eukprot:8093692-Pyramimonas_sp.AAC.1
MPHALPAHIDQPSAELYLPPGAYIWSASRGEWRAHLPPNRPRINEPFTKHGSSQAAVKACLRAVWDQYLETRGLDRA